MKNAEFRTRTQRFATDVIQLCEKLPSRRGIFILINQLIRSSASTAANYREACRARSHAEFVSKIGICTQEADESQLWLELIRDGYEIASNRLERLINESDELIAILVSMSKTARRQERS